MEEERKETGERGICERAGDRVSDALLKVALGCQVAEVTEEYAEVDGKLKLLKRKKTKKDIPPDLKAVQLLLDKGEERSVESMTDEELEREKGRLLEILRKKEEAEGKKKAKASGEGKEARLGKTSKKKEEGKAE